MKYSALIIIIIAALVVTGLLLHYFTHILDFTHKKIDEKALYENLKKVEDTARSMISSYNGDLVTYEQYKDSNDPYKKELSDTALTRLNRTAVQYNEFFLKNSFLWKDNIPNDIKTELPIIKEAK